MNTYFVAYEDGTSDFVSARTDAQAVIAAIALNTGVGFVMREATNAELTALIRAHSLPLIADDDDD